MIGLWVFLIFLLLLSYLSFEDGIYWLSAIAGLLALILARSMYSDHLVDKKKRALQCSRCNGTGSTGTEKRTPHTGHPILGRQDYEVSINCTKCKGTGLNARGLEEREKWWKDYWEKHQREKNK